MFRRPQASLAAVFSLLLLPGLASAQSSLGTLIQNRSEELGGGQDFRSGMLTDDEAEEAPIVGDREQDAGKAKSSRDRSTANQLERLTRPIAQVQIRAIASGPTPESRASEFSKLPPPIAIHSLDLGPPPPGRYMCGFRHRPLYFEQRNLERCGSGFGYLQNVVSGAQFVASNILLSYHLCDERADCPVPTGGDCLTCEELPADCGLIPCNRRALVSEAAALAGFSLLLL